MVTIYDVAKYIVDRIAPLSTMRLQVICFFCQAMSMIWDGQPLFKNDFKAWSKGPVCRELYETNKGVFDVCDSSFLDTFRPDISRLTYDQTETINAVVAALKDLPAYKLYQLAFDGEPWLKARASKDTTITKKSMKEYYAKHWNG